MDESLREIEKLWLQGQISDLTYLAKLRRLEGAIELLQVQTQYPETRFRVWANLRIAETDSLFGPWDLDEKLDQVLINKPTLNYSEIQDQFPEILVALEHAEIQLDSLSQDTFKIERTPRDDRIIWEVWSREAGIKNYHAFHRLGATDFDFDEAVIEDTKESILHYTDRLGGISQIQPRSERFFLGRISIDPQKVQLACQEFAIQEQIDPTLLGESATDLIELAIKETIREARISMEEAGADNVETEVFKIKVGLAVEQGTLLIDSTNHKAQDLGGPLEAILLVVQAEAERCPETVASFTVDANLVNIVFAEYDNIGRSDYLDLLRTQNNYVQHQIFWFPNQLWERRVNPQSLR